MPLLKKKKKTLLFYSSPLCSVNLNLKYQPRLSLHSQPTLSNPSQNSLSMSPLAYPYIWTQRNYNCNNRKGQFSSKMNPEIVRYFSDDRKVISLCRSSVSHFGAQSSLFQIIIANKKNNHRITSKLYQKAFFIKFSWLFDWCSIVFRWYSDDILMVFQWWWLLFLTISRWLFYGVFFISSPRFLSWGYFSNWLNSKPYLINFPSIFKGIYSILFYFRIFNYFLNKIMYI